MNKYFLVGNLGSDIEVKTSDNGTVYAQFSLAYNDRVKDGDEYVDRTVWLPFVAFGSLASSLSKLLKGSQLIVEAEAKNNSFEVGGKTYQTVEFVARRVTFGRVKLAEPAPSAATSPVPPAAAAAEVPVAAAA